MRVEDLRVGNFVETLKSDFFDGDTIDWSLDMFYWVAECVYHIEDFKPIPLTEEIHNDLGIYKNGFDSFEYELPRGRSLNIKVIFNGDYVYLRQSNDDRLYNDSLIAVWNRDVKGRDMYVHEWQNLYFALTGEELEFKTLGK